MQISFSFPKNILRGVLSKTSSFSLLFRIIISSRHNFSPCLTFSLMLYQFVHNEDHYCKYSTVNCFIYSLASCLHNCTSVFSKIMHYPCLQVIIISYLRLWKLINSKRCAKHIKKYNGLQFFSFNFYRRKCIVFKLNSLTLRRLLRYKCCLRLII